MRTSSSQLPAQSPPMAPARVGKGWPGPRTEAVQLPCSVRSVPSAWPAAPFSGATGGPEGQFPQGTETSNPATQENQACGPDVPSSGDKCYVLAFFGLEGKCGSRISTALSFRCPSLLRLSRGEAAEAFDSEIVRGSRKLQQKRPCALHVISWCLRLIPDQRPETSPGGTWPRAWIPAATTVADG